MTSRATTFGFLIVAACGAKQSSSSSSDACPSAIHDAVTRAYPHGQQHGCKLEREDGHDQYEVKLVQADGSQAEVELALDGTITQLEERIAIAALPAEVTHAFSEKYPGVTPARAERITQPGKPMQFELAVGDREEVTFTATGDLVEVEGAAGYTKSVIALPGGGSDGVMMDYLLFNPRTNTVWVPAGNTAGVDVIDTKTHAIVRVEGFATKEMVRHGKKRTVGPSSATLGEVGTVYVGNRGDSSVCAVDERTLTKRTCGTLDAMPDGIEYVAPTHEVWVTTPRDKSVRILDATTLAQKARLAFDGEPEGFAVDATRGWFYTNLEDKDVTLAISLASHETVATWHPSCGEDGPHGLRLAEAEGRLLVACGAEVHALDVTHGGAVVGKLAVGDGVDDLDLDAASHTVYAAGGKAASLSVISLRPDGSLVLVVQTPTGEGARNGVVAANGEVYLSHAKGSELVVLTPEKKED
ncbi:MAG: hypothetical protein ABI591_00545 [Kofleriaceae bacterium]